jgi:hypothetical protein
MFPMSARSPFQISRRGFVVGVAATGVLAACGSSDNGSSDSDAPNTDAQDGGDTIDEAAPGIAFGSFILAQRFPQDVQGPGLLRLPISLAGNDGRLVSDGPDSLRAEVHDIDDNPLDISISAVRRDLEGGAYYSFRVPIETPGFYYLVVEGGPEGGAAFQVM